MRPSAKITMKRVLNDILNNDDVVNSIQKSGFTIKEIEAACVAAGHGTILGCVTDVKVCQLTEREIDTIKFLVKAGCDVNSISADPRYSIYVNAIMTNNIGLASVMLDLGAKRFATTDKNRMNAITSINHTHFETQACSYAAITKVIQAEIKAGMNIHPSLNETCAPLANALWMVLDTSFTEHVYTKELLTAANVLIENGASLSVGEFNTQRSCLRTMIQGNYYIEHLIEMLGNLDISNELKPNDTDYEIQGIEEYFSHKLSKAASEAITNSTSKTSPRRI